MSDILVSIICNAYNHEPFVADAINSFLMQKANFKFEVLIHDDASTDNTADIIREYQNRTPDIIKPIYQVENQYSKGIKITKINSDRARGKYIALCEGDDYWTDPLKLQKQVDFLEKNPDTSLCVHGVTMINAKTNEKIDTLSPASESRYFFTDEIIFGGGGLFATNSMVFRKEHFNWTPDFYNDCKVGDYPLTIFLSLMGKVYFLNEYMSVYRSAVPGSWTEHFVSEFEIQKNHYKGIEKMLKEVDQFSGFNYTSVIFQTILRDDFILHLGHGRINEMKKEELKSFYSELNKSRELHQYYNALSKKDKFKINVNKYTPNLFNYIIKVKRMF